MTVRTSLRLAACAALLLLAAPAAAQTSQELELLRSEVPQDQGARFGFFGIWETWANINRDRPETGMWLWLSPQVKWEPAAMRAQLNLKINFDFLKRMDNYGTYIDDPSLEFAVDRIVQDPDKIFTLGAKVRYFVPASKASMDANSRGQLRGYLKATVMVWKLMFAAEFNAQKYFNKFTTWAPDAPAGSDSWFQSMGREDVIENNTSYGLGETLYGTYTPIDGLDISLIWGLIQSRHYQPTTGHGDQYGSSYLQDPRWTTWDHAFKFIADVTWNIGAAPSIAESDSLKDSFLTNLYLSAGYFILAPQLQNGGTTRSLNPFNPKYASVYFDVSVVY